MLMRWSLVGIIALFGLQANCHAWPNLKIPTKNKMQIKFGQAQSEELDPEHISLLVWNMYKGEKESWSEDINELGQSRDILILQEMFLNEKMKSTFEEFKDHQFDAGISFIYEEDMIPTGVITASKVEPIFSNAVRSPRREPIIKTPKMSMVTKYKLKGLKESLLVLNIHAVNFVSTKKLSYQLYNLASIAKEHKGPIIFAGDFNTWSKKKANLLFDLMNRLGLKVVKFDKEHDDRMRVFGRIIDFIFIKGLSYSDAKVWGQIEGSDHKAMTVNLKVN
ncbi:endonuclease/exonuclease/phosphatase family protein [Halobacteriovorax sp. GB3]|uniref:endonuclease/exonuclease/phosphatase family protein n=1 Tax=Halobacteriovorax sp. GB3 TaxID=2719615 RepID=UPI00235E97C3|nr:endonuclease/exonuclease/phosphatase family protein [Halobacteriovorax sp. GB3]MDD0853903.1 endonuclease/exonuclease/phosphatase family protein [Halobacteriovorax sp. GB3]